MDYDKQKLITELVPPKGAGLYLIVCKVMPPEIASLVNIDRLLYITMLQQIYANIS